MARLISLQGLAENINNVYFISPLEEFLLDISKTYVSSRQRGENTKNNTFLFELRLPLKKKKKRLSFQTDIFKPSVLFLAFTLALTERRCSKIQIFN